MTSTSTTTEQGAARLNLTHALNLITQTSSVLCGLEVCDRMMNTYKAIATHEYRKSLESYAEEAVNSYLDGTYDKLHLAIEYATESTYWNTHGNGIAITLLCTSNPDACEDYEASRDADRAFYSLIADVRDTIEHTVDLDELRDIAENFPGPDESKFLPDYAEDLLNTLTDCCPDWDGDEHDVALVESVDRILGRADWEDDPGALETLVDELMVAIKERCPEGLRFDTDYTQHRFVWDRS